MNRTKDIFDAHSTMDRGGVAPNTMGSPPVVFNPPLPEKNRRRTSIDKGTVAEGQAFLNRQGSPSVRRGRSASPPKGVTFADPLVLPTTQDSQATLDWSQAKPGAAPPQGRQLPRTPVVPTPVATNPEAWPETNPFKKSSAAQKMAGTPGAFEYERDTGVVPFPDLTIHKSTTPTTPAPKSAMAVFGEEEEEEAVDENNTTQLEIDPETPVESVESQAQAETDSDEDDLDPARAIAKEGELVSDKSPFLPKGLSDDEFRKWQATYGQTFQPRQRYDTVVNAEDRSTVYYLKHDGAYIDQVDLSFLIKPIPRDVGVTPQVVQCSVHGTKDFKQKIKNYPEVWLDFITRLQVIHKSQEAQVESLVDALNEKEAEMKELQAGSQHSGTVATQLQDQIATLQLQVAAKNKSFSDFVSLQNEVAQKTKAYNDSVSTAEQFQKAYDAEAAESKRAWDSYDRVKGREDTLKKLLQAEKDSHRQSKEELMKKIRALEKPIPVNVGNATMIGEPEAALPMMSGAIRSSHHRRTSVDVPQETVGIVNAGDPRLHRGATPITNLNAAAGAGFVPPAASLPMPPPPPHPLLNRAASAAPSAGGSSSDGYIPKRTLDNPEKFDGKTPKFSEWLANAKGVLRGDEKHFTAIGDINTVAVMFRWIKDEAWEALKSRNIDFVREGTAAAQQVIQTPQQFIDAIRDIYSDPWEEKRAYETYLELKSSGKMKNEEDFRPFLSRWRGCTANMRPIPDWQLIDDFQEMITTYLRKDARSTYNLNQHSTIQDWINACTAVSETHIEDKRRAKQHSTTNDNGGATSSRGARGANRGNAQTSSNTTSSSTTTTTVTTGGRGGGGGGRGRGGGAAGRGGLRPGYNPSGRLIKTGPGTAWPHGYPDATQQTKLTEEQRCWRCRKITNPPHSSSDAKACVDHPGHAKAISNAVAEVQGDDGAVELDHVDLQENDLS